MCFLLQLTNDHLTDTYFIVLTVHILYVGNKPAIAHSPRTIWPVFSTFLIFCCYFTCLMACEKSQQNMRLRKQKLYCIRK